MIGPDKAGSTWFYRLAKDLAGVATPAAKDTFFFLDQYWRGLKWYEDKYTDPNGKPIAWFEACHDYLYSEDAARRIRQHYPQAKLLIVARNPIDRAISSYLYMKRQGRLESDFSDALVTHGELLDHGRYCTHITTYLKYFPKSQLEVWDFDRLATDPQSVARDFAALLGVPAQDLGSHTLKPARPAAEARVQWIATQGRRISTRMRAYGLDNAVGRLKETSLIEKALFRPIPQESRPIPSQDDLEYIFEGLSKDAIDLDALLGTEYFEAWYA